MHRENPYEVPIVFSENDSVPLSSQKGIGGMNKLANNTFDTLNTINYTDIPAKSL